MSAETDSSQETTPKIPRRLAKQINLPFYDDDRVEEVRPREPGVVTSAVESGVRAVRLQCTGVVHSIKRFNSSVAQKYNTAKAHSLGVVDFFQSEPELWQRCGIVAAAGLTGVIAAYKRPTLIKTRNLLLSSGVAAAICWPKQTVEAVSEGYHLVRDPTVQLWTEYAPWSPYRPITTASAPPAQFYNNQTVVEDHGQSEAEDKDMYSTRSS